MPPDKLVLQTPRLVLREMGMADLDFVATMLTDPDVMRFWPRPYTREQCADWIRRQEERYSRDGHGYWLVVDKASAQPVGQAGLIRQEVDGVDQTGLGYIVHRPFWRRGFATEAAAECLAHALFTLGKQEVIALIRPENQPSQRLARRLGMKLRKRTTYAGLDHFVFAIPRQDCEPRGPAAG